MHKHTHEIFKGERSEREAQWSGTCPACGQLGNLPSMNKAGFNNQELLIIRKNSRGPPRQTRASLGPIDSESVSETDLSPGFICGSED